MPIVVDASVVLAWTFQDESNPYADSILGRLSQEEAVVPSLWQFELANSLVQAQRRGRASERDIVQLRKLIENMHVKTSFQSVDLVIRVVLELARSHRLTVYDAAYLEIAMREGLPLATLDDDLRAAAERVGVELAL